MDVISENLEARVRASESAIPAGGGDCAAPRSGRAPIFRFMAYMRPHLGMALVAIVAGVLKFVLPLSFPLAFKYVVDVLVAAHPKMDRIDLAINRWCVGLASALGFGASTYAKWEALTVTLLVLYVLQAVASYCRDYYGLTAGSGLIYDLRRALFAHMQRLSHAFFDRTQTGEIFSRLVNDVDLAQEFTFSALTNVWIDAVSIAVAAWLLIAMNPRLALAAFVAMPCYVAVVRYFAPRIKAATHLLQESMARVSGDLQERIAGVATIKAFNRGDYEIERFNLQTRVLYDHTLTKIRLAAWQQGWTELLARLAPTAVVWCAAILVVRGAVTLGTMIAFAGFIGYLYQPLERLSSMSIVMASAMAAIERIFAFLDLRPDIGSHPLSRPSDEICGEITFEQVSFAYGAANGESAREVLREINLTIPAGATVAFVGRSGAGKTTLASLIPRFYEATGGRILIDGKNIRGLTLESLRDRVGVVPQEVNLFSASVRELMRYAKADAGDEEILNALDQANLREFVERLPRGLDTVIGKRGVNVSGGQRQRFALARIFLKNPPILIMDEATSALDSEAENFVYDAMRRLMRGRTSLVIAHRLRAAVHADFVVAMDGGRIVEVGSHAALLETEGLYAQLFHEQLRGLLPERYNEARPSTNRAPRLAFQDERAGRDSSLSGSAPAHANRARRAV